MLSIENLTRTEKLRMMEVIWDDLSRDSETFSSPEWHAQALKDAERILRGQVRIKFAPRSFGRRAQATASSDE